jgi:hypothetical protein
MFLSSRVLVVGFLVASLWRAVKCLSVGVLWWPVMCPSGRGWWYAI